VLYNVYAIIEAKLAKFLQQVDLNPIVCNSRDNNLDIRRQSFYISLPAEAVTIAILTYIRVIPRLMLPYEQKS